MNNVGHALASISNNFKLVQGAFFLDSAIGELAIGTRHFSLEDGKNVYATLDYS